MRIIAGRNRSVRLASVGKGDAGAHLRPTSDRVRESLFNVLGSMDVIEEAIVLDLFAGTGALGLEALSRGAARLTCVDNGRAALRLLSENIEKLRVQDMTRTLKVDARQLPFCDAPPATLVFMDPPYGRGFGHVALQAALTGGWIAENATVVWEENAAIAAPDGFRVEDNRRYGDTYVTILSKL